MKRSEFGFKEWCEFAPMHAHTFRCNGGLFYVSLNEFHATSLNLDDACRVSVERFTESRIGYDIPWEPDKPDFSTWSRDECEEYFKEQKCNWHTYSNTSGRLMGGTYSAIMLDDKFYSHFGDAINGPSLKNYQDAAEYVWEKVNK